MKHFEVLVLLYLESCLDFQNVIVLRNVRHLLRCLLLALNMHLVKLVLCLFPFQRQLSALIFGETIICMLFKRVFL